MGERRRGARLPLASLAAVALAMLAPLATIAQPTSAQPAPIPLVVQRAPAAADCADATALAEHVDRLAGRHVLVAATDSNGAFAFEVQILKSEDGYTAIVLAAGKSRQIADPGPTCASLSDALALTLAILVDADEPPPPPPPPPPTARSTAPLPTIPVPRLPPPPVYGPRLFLTPHVGLASGLSGDAVPALVLTNDLRIIGPWSVLAGFTWMPSQDFALAPGRVEVQLMYGQIAGCLSTWTLFGSSRLGACLGLNAGGLRGKGIGFLQNKEVTRPWTSFSAAALLDVFLWGPLYWSSRVSGFAVVPQEAFAVDNIGVAFDPPPVGLLVSTGVGLKFL